MQSRYYSVARELKELAQNHKKDSLVSEVSDYMCKHRTLSLEKKAKGVEEIITRYSGDANSSEDYLELALELENVSNIFNDAIIEGTWRRSKGQGHIEELIENTHRRLVNFTYDGENTFYSEDKNGSLGVIKNVGKYGFVGGAILALAACISPNTNYVDQSIAKGDGSQQVNLGAGDALGNELFSKYTRDLFPKSVRLNDIDLNGRKSVAYKLKKIEDEQERSGRWEDSVRDNPISIVYASELEARNVEVDGDGKPGKFFQAKADNTSRILLTNIYKMHGDGHELRSTHASHIRSGLNVDLATIIGVSSSQDVSENDEIYDNGNDLYLYEIVSDKNIEEELNSVIPDTLIISTVDNSENPLTYSEQIELAREYMGDNTTWDRKKEILTGDWDFVGWDARQQVLKEMARN